MNVLMVEDDSAMARMCAKFLRRRGHTIHLAGSAEEALSIVEGQKNLDVVVSDVHMPRMSGIQLLQRVRAIDNSIPFVLMTGYTHIVSASQAIALGAADYIVKPFEPEVFVHCLERVLRASTDFPYTRAE